MSLASERAGKKFCSALAAAVGNSPELSELRKRSVEFVSVAKSNTIDTMRCGTMYAVGVLPERPGSKGRRDVLRLRARILGEPEKAFG